MTPARRHRVWRPATVLPAVLSALIGIGAVAVISTDSIPAASASFTDRAPIAGLDSFYQRPGGMRAIGWDFDPDAPTTALRTYSGVDNKFVNATTSSISRSDVALVHPHAGPNHGFNFTIPVPEGTHKVCLAAKNIGAGFDYHFACVTKTFDYGPFGHLDSMSTRPGQIYVKGWAMDSDAITAPITTTVTIDGVAHTLIANKSRPDVATVRPGAGPNHGFEASYPVSQGSHTVCVTTKNIGYGSDNSFGCRTITLNDSPHGSLESAAKSAGQLRVAGWTFDNDAPKTALTVDIKVDGTIHTVLANTTRTDIGAKYPTAGAAHGYVQSYAVAEGSHTVCVTAHNIGFGSNTTFPCRTAVLNFTPAAAINTLTATSTGARVSGWASDPDTSAPISVTITVDGHLMRTMTASAAGSTHTGHNFAASLTLKSGTHNVCIVGLNASYGTHNSAPVCRSITLALKPIGAFESLTRAPGTDDLLIKGWALDPDTTAPLTIWMTMGGHTFPSLTAGAARPDIATLYPAFGANHGISSVVGANDLEHTVCLTAVNVGGGSRLELGCKLIIAVHPFAPTAPQTVTALAGYGGATVSWTKPASDGGAPWSKYTVTASGGPSVTVGATATSATVTGLKPSTTYTFTVTATNVAGTSPAATSPAVKTQATPPAQTTPAPVSTSRYIRNISSASATELAMMRAEGAADARANPSGHGYLILLDIGGQDQFDNGVVLSATTHFVPYSTLQKDLQAYAAGYHSAQLVSAPVTIAVGTNNDMDVSYTTGQAWANSVIDPLAAYAKQFPGMTIAGANDIEPGFRATYTATRSWLSGYLGATTAPFVFNGSADGCAWTVINRGCNNGWTMSGLYTLAAGAAPIRMLNLPQIYNYTMADQWKYISLTGVAASHPRINFGGTLTEYTACVQSGSCGSIGGHTAWSKLWSNLQSDARLKVASLPYSTDLRIN